MYLFYIDVFPNLTFFLCVKEVDFYTRYFPVEKSYLYNIMSYSRYF